VIADAEEEWHIPEGLQLVALGVEPGVGEILGDRGVGVQLPKVLIEIADEAQVTEVPVEARTAGLCSGGDRGHHDVAAVARVAGYDERPGRRARCGM